MMLSVPSAAVRPRSVPCGPLFTSTRSRSENMALTPRGRGSCTTIDVGRGGGIAELGVVRSADAGHLERVGFQHGVVGRRCRQREREEGEQSRNSGRALEKSHVTP